MEVILKKAKINTSILKQTLVSTENDLLTSEVLGWCIFNKVKFIVLYNEQTFKLTRYLAFQDFTCIEKDKAFYIEVKFGGGFIPKKYTFDKESEKDVFLFKLKEIKNLSEAKGQFFI